MRRRTTVVAFIGLALAGGFGASQLLFAQGKGSPLTKYELEWKTEIKNGIRAYPESVYTFFEKLPGGKRKELWTAKTNDKPLRHWISSVGNCYVLTDPMPGPGQASRIWLRNKEGELEGTFPSHQLAKPKPIAGQAIYGLGQLIDADAVQIRELRRGVAEELVLPVKDWGQGKLVVYWPTAKEKPRAFAYWQPDRKSPEPLLEKVLADEDYRLPTSEMPLSQEFGLMLWTATSKNPGQPDLRWFQSGSYTYPGASGYEMSQLATVSSEHVLAEKPEWIKPLPGWKVAWMEFGPQTARLKVLSGGKTEAELDLLDLGKFKTPQEAKKSLLGGKAYVYGQGWQEAGIWPIQSSGPVVLLELWDTASRRYLINLGKEGKVSARMFSGVEARRPTDMQYPFEVKDEKVSYFTSPSKNFTLRVRDQQLGNGEDKYFPRTQRITLLAKVPNDEGKLVDIELWTHQNYAELEGVRVTDAGHAMWFEFGWTKAYGRNDSEGKMQRRGAGYIWGADGNQIAGWDLQQFNYDDPDEARKGIVFDKIVFEPFGKKSEVIISGLTLPEWQYERVEIPLRSGRVDKHYILQEAFNGRNRIFPDQAWIRKMIDGVK